MFAYIDTEYIDNSNEFVIPVCCSVSREVNSSEASSVEEFWLLNDKEVQAKLVSHMEELHEAGYTFVCHSGTAEGSCLLACGLTDLFKYRVIDTHAEYKGVLNHSEYSHGAQLIDGNVKFTEPKLTKWDKEKGEEQEFASDKASSSYAAAAFKLLGIRVDLKRKDMMRDIIISGNIRNIEAHKDEIISYCSSDIDHLPGLLNKIMEINGDLVVKTLGYSKAEFMESMITRGRLTFSTCSYMKQVGIPINYEALLNLSENIEQVYAEAHADASIKILSKEKFTPFFYSVKDRKWHTIEKSIQSWIASSEYATRWPTTNSGAYSLASESFTMFCKERHDFEDSFIQQMVKILNLKSSLNSMRTGNKKNFFDACGEDRRSRPYLNPFGTQSARFAPPATTFLFAKTAWLRSLCNTQEGEIMLSFDYSSEEFLLAAILAEDEDMMEAYKDGDVYLYTAKLAKAVPQDATKQSHPKKRQLFKAVVLGVSFLMGKTGLAEELEGLLLTPDERRVGVGRRFKTDADKMEFLVEEAEELLGLFWGAYPDLQSYMDSIYPEYKGNEGLVIPKILFPMHGLNRNKRSVSNVRTQGSGSAILIEALDQLVQYGLKKYHKPIVTNGLHDAVYLCVPYTDYPTLVQTIKDVCVIMEEAYQSWVVWLGLNPARVPKIRMAGEAWASWITPASFPIEMKEVSKGFFEGETTIETPIGNVNLAIANLHRDERVSINDFLGYTKYLRKQETSQWNV